MAKGKVGATRTYISSVIWHLELAFWAIIGALGRSALVSLTGFEYGGPLWANVAGCFVMGSHDRLLLDEKLASNVGVGFCGSVTSFSATIVTLYTYSTTPTAAWNNYGYGLMVAIGYIIVQLGCSIAAFFFGSHFVIFYEHYKFKPMPHLYWGSDVLATAGIVAWIACLVVAICVEHERHWPLTGVFAPIGVYARVYLGKLNTSGQRTGTFLANMSGTVIACVLAVLKDSRFGFSYIQLQVLQSLIDGFCGNLTTVSTLVKELVMILPLSKAYRYGALTFGCGIAIAVLSLGVYHWTR